MFGRRREAPPVVVMPPAPQAAPEKSSGLFGADGTMKGLGEHYGERPWQRRTYGNPDRTRAVGMMEAFADAFGFPELRDAAHHASHSWASEDGWDTAQFIEAVGAAKGQSPAVQFGDRGGR
jgi:hypothetical protein